MAGRQREPAGQKRQIITLDQKNEGDVHTGQSIVAKFRLKDDSMILDLFRLDGRVAVVTGAGRGLGQAMAIALAEAGADVATVTRSGECAETAQRITDLGKRFWSFRADLGDASQRAGLIARMTEQTGPIDILVNNAGITGRHLPEVYPLDHWGQMLEVHLTAAFDLSQQVALGMLERGTGKIVNIGSVMSFQGGFNIPAYAAAKHGLAGLTKSLANAWSSRGINVNCLCPGYFETELSGPLQDDPVRGPQILVRIPAGRWAQPEELGGMVVFLASDASKYVHGSIIAIDGGWLAR